MEAPETLAVRQQQQQLLQALLSYATTASKASLHISKLHYSLATRANCALLNFRKQAGIVHAELCVVLTSHAAAARSRFRVLHDKLLEDIAEEADANSRLLEALAAACESHSLPINTDVFNLRLDSLPLEFLLRSHCFSDCVLPVCCMPSSLLHECTTVWKDSIDASRSVVSGPGVSGYVPMNAEANRIRVLACISNGASADYVVSDDVTVAITGMDGVGKCGDAAFTVDSTGTVDITYSVLDISVAEVLVSVTICGVPLFSNIVAVRRITGIHACKLRIASGMSRSGIAVSQDARYFAVSYESEHQIRVYECMPEGFLNCANGSSAVRLKLVHKIDHSEPGGPGLFQFSVLGGVCSVPASKHILACDLRQLKEIYVFDHQPPALIRSIDVLGSRCAAVHGDVIAVGTYRATIELLQYSNGSPIRTIASLGVGPGQIGKYCAGVAFTRDGCHVIAAEAAMPRLSVFAVVDGAFERHLGVGELSCGDNDVVVDANGEVFAADFHNNRVCVFNPGDGMLVRVMGSAGVGNGKLQNPTALALAADKLLVLDHVSMYVQVFA